MAGFIGHNFRWIAGGFLLTFFSSFGQTFFISASIGEWQDQFGLSHGAFGQLYMVATLASALTLPFLGRVVDHIPEHLVIAFTVPILAGATLAAAFAPSVVMLGAAIYLLRLFGQGMMSHIALTATGRWFAASRGRAISLVVLGYRGGEAVLLVGFVTIAAVYGYRAGWVAGAGALLVIALPLCVWAYAQPREPEGRAAPAPGAADAQERSWTRGEVMRDPVFYMLLVGTLAPPFIGTTLFFHQDYMTELRAWPTTLFASGLSVMAVVTVSVALVMGAVIDRFSARAVLPYFLYPLAAACVLAGSVAAPMGLYGFMVLLGVSYGVSSTLFGSLWPEVYGTAHLGAIRSVTVAAAVIATAAGPGLTGTLIDFGIALPAQLLAMAVYCLIAAAMMVVAAGALKRRTSMRS